MSKYFRSEYVFSVFIFVLLALATGVFLKLAPEHGNVIITGFYASFVAPLVAAFKSKYETDKTKNTGVKNGKD